MHVRFWGTRGSIATPGKQTARYGGNTSCVEVRGGDGTLIVLDCGTGARGLGLHLAEIALPPRLHLFIGHTHWDHIQGFPFFVPAFMPGAELNIYAPLGFQRGLEEAMAGQMEYSYFPVKLRDLRSRIHFTELDEGFFRVGDVLIETQYLNHTAPTIAYRISSGGASIAYATDHEPFWNASAGRYQHPGDQRHIEFMRDVDLIIHDAQYTEEEYPAKKGWGHSTVEYATDVARAAGARRLALFHHDPGHDDATLDRIEALARDRVGRDLEVFAAAEGLEVEVRGGGANARAKTDVSALVRRPIAGGRVLLVTANVSEVATIQDVLDEEDLVLVPVPDAGSALARGADVMPDLAIIDAKLPDGDGATLVAQLRARVGRSMLPVVLLTDVADGARGDLDGTGEADDVLAKPFSPPMLHARVRAWLARALAAEDRRQEPVLTSLAPLNSETLRSVPVFREMKRDELEALLAQAGERQFPPGHVLIAEGEIPEHVFVIISGRVRVIEAMPDAQTEVVLGELGPGEIVGELGILTERPRSATVVVLERTRCLALRRFHFLQALERSPALALGLAKLLARRLYDSDRRIARYAPDALTGLASRRAFLDLYRRIAASARRRKSGLFLVLLDVHHLNAINDRFGYAVGDDVLRAVADALMEATRATDLVARYGADEFVVLLQDAGSREGHLVTPRFGEKLSELLARRGLNVPIKCRVGTAYRELPPDSSDELLREADEDMRRRGVTLPA